MTSILTPSEDQHGESYNTLVDSISEFAGGLKFGFSQPNYLSLKHNGHMLKAVSNIMRGNNCLYKQHSPGE